jgi:hypothetical protein
MAAFIDPVTFIVRAGPSANEYGDTWRSCCSVTIQHDRRVYMSAVTSAGSDRYTALADFKDMIRAVRREARRHNWTEIISNRIAPDGTERIMRVSINHQQHGANRMAKEKIPSLKGLKKADGSIDWDAGIAALALCKQQELDGHYTFEIKKLDEHDHGKSGDADLHMHVKRSAVDQSAAV